MFRSYVLVLIIAVASALSSAAQAQETSKPNIVFIFLDNFGYGELGVYGGGITRGAPTKRIDALAQEGMRLLNFNVEAQCTPSRAALMTGRYAIRSGNGSVPLTTGRYGLTQWEYTMAEMLSDAGYATGMFGKWHLGHTKGRFPTDQGFDEWYGVPNSTDESLWPDQPQFNAVVKEKISPYVVPEYIYEGKKGSAPRKVKVYNSRERPEIDGELTKRGIDFMRRQVAKRKPFFLFLPYTQTHMPVVPSAEFKNKSGNGDWGDVLLQIDAYTGRLLDTVEELGIKDNTIFIFTSDNGPEMLPGHNGWSGPWRGSYFTGLEGSLRVPFIIRWPGKVPAGVVSNDIVHEFDMYATFAKWGGAKIPKDRIIDSVDQSDFLTGKKEKSGRDGFVVYVGNDLFGIKWRNWKMMFKEVERGTDDKKVFDLPHFINLYNDPKEEYPITKATAGHLWVRWPMAEILTEHTNSLKKEPPIKPGTPDPYQPPKKKAGVTPAQKKASLEDVKTINLRLTVDGRIAIYGVQFDLNEAAIKPTSKATISSIASVMQAKPKLKIAVVGHTDSLGSHEMNMRLSKLRADAVVRELRTKHNIAPGRMFAAGAGFLAPLSTNDTDDGRTLNRRVELIRMK